MKAFAGFSNDAFSFLDALAADNSAANFARRRDSYRSELAEPASAFVVSLIPELRRTVHPELEGEPKVGKSLFRINRDTRFGADKTPYKTYLDLLFWVGDQPPRESPACIIRITSTTMLIGAGRMGLGKDQLERYRAAVADETTGSQLRGIVDGLVDKGAELGEASRVKVPRPYRPDHPNADLLRRDGFHCTHTSRHPREMTNDRLVPWCAEKFGRYSDLLGWFVDTA